MSATQKVIVNVLAGLLLMAVGSGVTSAFSDRAFKVQTTMRLDASEMKDAKQDEQIEELQKTLNSHEAIMREQVTLLRELKRTVDLMFNRMIKDSD